MKSSLLIFKDLILQINPFNARNKPSRRSQVILLIIISLLLLLPFSNKAFNVDEPLFLWMAKQIQAHPLDPYGFVMNWYFTPMNFSEILKNPPLNSYYIAGIASLVGYSERALHFAFLIPAIALIIGVYFLAKKFTAHAFIAAAFVIITPVFLISACSVMCDIMMLCFWVWAMFFWIKGIDENKKTSLLLSAFLIALSGLIKYFGIAIIPLLFLYALVKKRSLGIWIFYFLLPVSIFLWYHLQTKLIYGHSLLFDAASYANNFKSLSGEGFLVKGLIGLSFTGGCLIGAIFFLPFMFSRKQLLVHLIGFLAAILIIILFNKASLNVFNLALPGIIQLALFITLGVSLLILVVLDLYTDQNNASIVLLFLWVLSVFLFASFINWTVNSRSVLPMVPAIAIIIARRIEKLNSPHLKSSKIFLSFILAAFMGLCVLFSDYIWANTCKDAAQIMNKNFSQNKDKVLFEGHWVFQYYMDKYGFKSADMQNLILSEGLIVIIPENSNNTFTVGLPREIVKRREVIEIKPLSWLSVMNGNVGAGFYADIWGPLPFAFGNVPAERYYIFQCVSK